MDQIDKYAKIIWDYMLMNHPLEKADVILGLGSHDTNVAKRVADIYLLGYAPAVVFSGGYGTQTTGVFEKSEAEIFADIAIQMGVPKEKVLLENKATNTGENIVFTKNLLLQKGISLNKIIIVTKPYMERRAYATFMKQWVERVKIMMSSPQIEYDIYLSDPDYKKKSINIMVGDLVRIKEYPKLGFQIEQKIPRDVWHAGQELIKLGFDKHLP